MVVNEQAALSGGGAPYYPGTLALAAKIHRSTGRAWPVSGDRIAVDPAAVDRRALTPRQGTRRLAAGGWLQRSAGVQA